MQDLYNFWLDQSSVYFYTEANYRLLLCNKHYTGFTSNFSLRLKSHNEFGKDWTAKYRPWEMIFIKEFPSKSEAMIYERWLKSGIGSEFIKMLLH